MPIPFYKVNTLPGTLANDSIYAVMSGSNCELYVTSSTGVAKAVFSTSLTDAAIDAKIAALNVLIKVATIAARNALTLTANAMVLVVDATADGTVTAGAALYFYNHATTSFTKVAEYESMDVVTTWASISGKPTSSAAAIDAAVTASHTHTNLAVLAALTDVSGVIKYNGVAIGANWSQTDW